VIQLRTQTEAYWGPEFALTEGDIEHISTYFLEKERPQTAEQLTRALMAHRVAAERSDAERLLTGRTVYQPHKSYQIGEEVIFPALEFVHSTVDQVRDGQNPQFGQFNVIQVKINGRNREFATALKTEHALNVPDDTDVFADLISTDLDGLYTMYGAPVRSKLIVALSKNQEFIRLSGKWFMKALLAEINVGHLHLAEAILEMSEGGPASAEAILPHLDLDSSIHPEVQQFSLNYQLWQDGRFDEVAPVGEVEWFLKRMEPDEVKELPKRLAYNPISHDRALLSPQLMLLERELDDEWSNLEPSQIKQPVMFTLTYPHRLVGTIPFSTRIRPLFPESNSPRQRVVLLDEQTNEEIVAWVVREHRYIYGLKKWYNDQSMPIGGFIHLKPGPESGVLLIDYDRRRPQREWVRLATVVDNRLHFELNRRSISCGYDDLLIVGTDVITAVDALWKRAETNQRSIASLLAEIFPQLAELTPQKTVHAKTLYSAINMLRRVPPGPLFAELVRHPAFQSVGDHYWRFESDKWRST
jgi:hypothetical protein